MSEVLMCNAYGEEPYKCSLLRDAEKLMVTMWWGLIRGRGITSDAGLCDGGEVSGSIRKINLSNSSVTNTTQIISDITGSCSFYGSTALLLSLGRFFSFLIRHTVGRTAWTGVSPSQDRYLHTEQHKHRITHTDFHASSWIRTLDPSERRQFMP
jgi:hypothetical protein